MLRVETQAPASWGSARIARLPLLQDASGRHISSKLEWEQRKAELIADWQAYLGVAPYELKQPGVRLEPPQDLGYCTGQVVYIQTEPNYYEQCFLMVPKKLPAEKLPAVVVFYYDIDTPAGHNMGSKHWKEGAERAFAQALVQKGYVALVQRWFHEGYAHEAESTGTGLKARYQKGVERFRRLAPSWTGLGRVVWDAGRCVEFLQTLAYVDSEKIGCMGHSLGGKMALYAAAFDNRFKVAVSSDLGIGLPLSNWEAPWYLGPEVQRPDFPRDHHQLLAFIAPRPYLLIAGQFDGEQSWPYLNSARDVYQLYGAAERIGMANHATGHTPTLESLELAYNWFERYLKG